MEHLDIPSGSNGAKHHDGGTSPTHSCSIQITCQWSEAKWKTVCFLHYLQIPVDWLPMQMVSSKNIPIKHSCRITCWSKITSNSTFHLHQGCYWLNLWYDTGKLSKKKEESSYHQNNIAAVEQGQRTWLRQHKLPVRDI